MHKIFVCGLDRSGTTFLASILASLPRSVVVSETPFKFEWLSAPKAKRIKERFDEKYYRVFGFETYDQAIASLDAQKIISSIDTSYKVIIDHTPKNRYFVAELIANYDDCSVLFIFRNDFDVYLSHQNVAWGDRALAVTIIRRFQTYLQYLYSKRMYGTKIGKVNFEDLIEEEYTNLTNFLKANDIIFDNLNVVPINLPDYTKAQHSLVGQAPDASKINKNPQKLIAKTLKKIHAVSPVVAFVISILFELIPNAIMRIIVQIKQKVSELY